MQRAQQAGALTHRKEAQAMNLKPWLLAAATSALLGVTAAHAAPQYFAHPLGPNMKPLPFSDAVLAGGTLYVAGHLGLDPKTGQAPADAGLEAKLVLDAVQATLKSAGFTMDDLVSVTVYCTDLALYETFNSAYAAYFHGQFPARAFIGAAGLVRGARFEIQGVAVKLDAVHH
jgi:2-iminobutanoate/2-iminopropanoate deaminase